MILSFHVASSISQEKMKLENQKEEEELQTSLKTLDKINGSCSIIPRS